MSQSLDRTPAEYDVIVIGAGPSGSSAAAVLARAGRKVLLLERLRVPRFHIGESMLPYTMKWLEHIGALEKIAAHNFPAKYGAEFIFQEGDFRRVAFADQGPGRYPSTWQVERAYFDGTLAEHARECGATFVQEAHVNTLLMDGDRVTGVQYVHEGRTHTVKAKWVIDAGGRASKVSQTFRLRKEIDRLKNVAVYRHFHGLDERWNPAESGDIQVGGHPDGWVWAIPIRADVISIGCVMPRRVLRASTPAQVFEEHLSRVPRIVQRLTGTTPMSEYRVETDYCYNTETPTGNGWFVVGDAACFNDPIFSGGAFVALSTGITAAQTVDEILGSPERTAELQERYTRFFKTGFDTYTRLIFAFYDSNYNLGRFLRQMGLDVTGAHFVRLLSGDFWTRNPLAEHLRTLPQYDTFAPFERLYGCPVYPELDAEEFGAVAA